MENAGGIIGGFANNLGIKDHDFGQISDKRVDQNNSNRTQVSVGTDFAGGYGSDRYRKNSNVFVIPKEEKAKTPDAEKGLLIKC